MTLLEAPYEVVASHEAPVQTVRCSADGSFILTGDVERNIRSWSGGELRFEKALRTKNAKASTSDRLRSVAIAPDGQQFYVASGQTIQGFGSADGNRLWNVALPNFLGFLVAVPLSLDVDDSGRVAIASDNGTFGYRDSFGRKLRQWKHNASPRWIRWMKSGEALIGSDSFSIRLWDANTGETIQGYETDERVYNLEACAKKNIFAVRTLHSVLIYSIDSPRPFAEIRTREGLPLLAFSPDGDFIAIGETHGAQVFSVPSGDDLRESVFEAQMTGDVAALSLAFSADGRALLIGCSDGSVRRFRSIVDG